MYKNTSGQKVTVLAIDVSTNLPKTGDAANLTVYVEKDDGACTALTDTSATEINSTYAKGLYRFDLTQAETNGNKLVFSGASTTANIEIVPQIVYTTDLKNFGVMFSGTVAAAASTTVVDLPAGASTNDDAYVGCFFQPTGGTGGDQAGSTVVDYDGTNKRMTLSPALDQAVSTDTTFLLFGGSVGVEAAYAPLVRAYDHNGTAIATNADMATLLGRLSSTRAGYLDNLSAAIASAADMATLLSRLSATRASYLDNLSAALATATGLTTLQTDVTSLLGRVTADRAGYLDNLSGGAVALASGVSLSADAVTSTALATSAVNEIRDAVFARAFHATKMGGYTFEELFAFIVCELMAKASNLPTNPTFRNLGDSADVIAASTDTDGNRASVTLTAASVR
jgi:hypothetical protein